MSFSCSINTQSFPNDKSSSFSQFISGKPRNPQKLLRYLNGIVTSTFKISTTCRFASSSFPGRAGVFHTMFAL